MKAYDPDRIRNVAIVGHSGSGKTMLVEHMLFTAGAADRVGDVSKGSTQSDFDPLEIKRQISINASVTPLEWNDHKLNVIDVPGFPDFIGDLEMVARVVDAMIIVVEAKADLDVGFDLAWEAAERNNVARAVFVNKLERDNADFDGLINTLDQRYGRRIVSAQIPIGHQAAFSGVLDLLTMKVYKGKDRGVDIHDVPSGYEMEAATRREKMMDAAAEGDDDLAMKYLEGEELSPEEIEKGLLQGTKNGKVVPVLVGSAETGIGIKTLMDRIIGEMPSPLYHKVTVKDEMIDEDPNGPLLGYVFKSTSDPYVGKLNFVRIFSGTLKADDVVTNSVQEVDERVHNLFIPRGKEHEPATEVRAGDICVIAKLADTHTGDTLCDKGKSSIVPNPDLPEPIYRVAIRPAEKSDEDKLGGAIEKLLEEDKTLRYLRDASVKQEVLEGMGDIHIETAIDKLRERYGVTVETETARVPYLETISAASDAQGRHKRQSGGRGQFGDCHIRLEPLPRGEGFAFASEVVGGAIPRNYIPAVEKGIKEAMENGIVAGFPVVDVRAVVTDGSYHDVDSSEAAFKIAGASGFKAAAEKANPVILEPIINVEIDVPEENVGDVVGDLNTRRGQMHGMEQREGGRTVINADVPMSTMTRYALDLRSLTHGRGRYKQAFARHQVLPHDEAEKLKKAQAAEGASVQ